MNADKFRAKEARMAVDKAKRLSHHANTAKNSAAHVLAARAHRDAGSKLGYAGKNAEGMYHVSQAQAHEATAASLSKQETAARAVKKTGSSSGSQGSTTDNTVTHSGVVKNYLRNGKLVRGYVKDPP